MEKTGSQRLPEEPVAKAQLFGSGTILRSVREAQLILAEQYNIAADVWSVTSYQQLYREARRCFRHNRFNPRGKKQIPYLTQALEGSEGPVIAASDWVSDLPQIVSDFVPQKFIVLGTDGFGRSDTRETLRRHFEVDAASIVITTLSTLYREGKVKAKLVNEAMRSFDWPKDKVDPVLL